jgi:hypothetical protein
MAKILVTCVGSGVGQSVIDSLNLVGIHQILGCDTNRNVYAYHFCDFFFIVPNIYSDEYIGFLLNLGIREKVDIIIPGHDHELLLLSKNITKFHDQGIQIIVSRPDLIEISRDKYEWYRYFKSYDCMIVPTFRVKEFKTNPDLTIFPAIVKPTGGSASQGISILNDKSELSKVNDTDIIQPYLYPKKDDPNFDTISTYVKKGQFIQMSEISIQLIFNKDSDFCGIFISKNSLKNGVPTFVDPIDPEKFEYIDEIMKFVPVCMEKKVIGPVNIQGRITERGLIFFEMNMRFTGITGNRAQLGFNEVEFLVDSFLGIPAFLNGFAKNKLGARQVACTTIPRIKENLESKTLTIIGSEGFLSRYFIQGIIDQGRYLKINVICPKENLEQFSSSLKDDRITIIGGNDISTESIYCSTDILIDFTNTQNFTNDKSRYESAIFQHEQVQKIIKSNIPCIFQVSSQIECCESNVYDELETSENKLNTVNDFQKNLIENFFKAIKYFNPATKLHFLNFPFLIDAYQSLTSQNGIFSEILISLLSGNEPRLAYQVNKLCFIDHRNALESLFYLLESIEHRSLPQHIKIKGTSVLLQEYYETSQKFLLEIKNQKTNTYSAHSKISEESSIQSKDLDELYLTNKYTLEQTIESLYNQLKKH